MGEIRELIAERFAEKWNACWSKRHINFTWN